MAFRASLSAGLLVGLMIMQHDSSATPKIPPGFEALAQGQLVWVDVSLYGKSLGLYEANINLEQVVLYVIWNCLFLDHAFFLRRKEYACFIVSIFTLHDG
ncbi:hypothetical protein [Serratia fonticola]